MQKRRRFRLLCVRFMCPPRKVSRPLTSCHTQGSKPTWDDSKKLLTDTKFLESLETYDKENIPDKTIKQLQKYINNPDFVPEKVKKVSTAATSLCMWVRAMDVYNRVAKNVEPKRKPECFAVDVAGAKLSGSHADKI